MRKSRYEPLCSESLPGILTHVHVNVSVSALLFLIGASLIILFVFIPSFRSELIFTSAIMGCLGTIYTGYYVAETLKLSITRDSVQKAFEICTNLNSINTVSLRSFIDLNVEHEKLSQEEIYEKIRSDSELLVATTSILSMFENAAISIKTGYVDEKTLYESLGHFIPYYYEKLLPYIKELRKRFDTRICEHMEALVAAWTKGSSLLTGTKIDSVF